MDMDERDTLSEITLERYPVVHVHEFRRNEPCSEAVILHPVMAEQQEITIETSEATNFQMKRLCQPCLEASLFFGLQMVVTDVWWVRKQQRKTVAGNGLPSEISLDNLKARSGPQAIGALCKKRIKLNPDGRLNSM